MKKTLLFGTIIGAAIVLGGCGGSDSGTDAGAADNAAVIEDQSSTDETADTSAQSEAPAKEESTEEPEAGETEAPDETEIESGKEAVEDKVDPYPQYMYVVNGFPYNVPEGYTIESEDANYIGNEICYMSVQLYDNDTGLSSLLCVGGSRVYTDYTIEEAGSIDYENGSIPVMFGSNEYGGYEYASIPNGETEIALELLVFNNKNYQGILEGLFPEMIKERTGLKKDLEYPELNDSNIEVDPNKYEYVFSYVADSENTPLIGLTTESGGSEEQNIYVDIYEGDAGTNSIKAMRIIDYDAPGEPDTDIYTESASSYNYNLLYRLYMMEDNQYGGIDHTKIVSKDLAETFMTGFGEMTVYFYETSDDYYGNMSKEVGILKNNGGHSLFISNYLTVKPEYEGHIKQVLTAMGMIE